jgi:MFS family permease
MRTPQTVSEPSRLVASLLFIALVVAAVGSLGAPLITSVATTFRVSLDSAQWTQTITLLSGAIVTPILGRMGAGPRRRGTILATLAVVVLGSALTVLPLSFVWLLVGRAAQGVGLGLTALMMGVARDHLPENRGHPLLPWSRWRPPSVSASATRSLVCSPTSAACAPLTGSGYSSPRSHS